MNRCSSSISTDHSIHLCDYSTSVSALDSSPSDLCITISTTDPFLLPKVQVDRGAIRFLLAGAHMMCPGLTSAGGYLPPADAAIPAGTPVAIHAEGKEHAVGVGITKLGTEEMRKVNKGIGVETATYLGDDLWALQTL